MVEVLTVAGATVAALVMSHHLRWANTGYVGPLALVRAAVLPIVVAHRPMAHLGLQLGQVVSTSRCLGIGSVILACLGLGVVAVFRGFGEEPPLRPSGGGASVSAMDPVSIPLYGPAGRVVFSGVSSQQHVVAVGRAFNSTCGAGGRVCGCAFCHCIRSLSRTGHRQLQCDSHVISRFDFWLEFC